MISALLGSALPLKSIRVRFLPRRYYCYIRGGAGGGGGGGVGGERNHLIVRTRKLTLQARWWEKCGGSGALNARRAAKLIAGL